MAVGQGSLISPLSYVAIGRETTLGTYNTASANLDFLSASLKTTQEKKLCEEITRKRVFSKVINMGKTVEGELEYYFYPEQASCNYLLQNAFGGSITSATATGETAGGAAFTHQYDIGQMGLTYPSICINQRKGEVTTGKVYQYNGVRTNELVITAELDEALKIKSGVIAFDSTINSNDVESALTLAAFEPLSFVGGRLSAENTFASLTSSSFWHVQSFELTFSNSLKADADSRRLGSDILQVLPVGMGTIDLTASIRFDTTTAHAAMLAKTKLALELEFTGDTLTGSIIKRGVKLQLPSVYVNDSGDPEIGGPDEILKSDVTFNVLQDVSSAGGFALRALVTNLTANYD